MNALPLLLLFTTIHSLLPPTHAHNRLISPTPWSPTPIKSAPCGGGFPLTIPQITWPKWSKRRIQWNVYGDGIGNLTALLDPLGGTNFSVVLIQNANYTKLGPNYFDFIVPDIACEGVSGSCSLQVFSTSGWYECSSISICRDCTSPPAPRAKCSKVYDKLEYCTSRNDKLILVGEGFEPSHLDQMVNWTVQEYLSMPIFTNASNPACRPQYKDFLCDTVIPTCGEDTKKLCKQQCENFVNACGLVPSHQGLYNCSRYRECSVVPDDDSTDEHEKIVFIIVGALVGAAIVLIFVSMLSAKISKCKKESYYQTI